MNADEVNVSELRIFMCQNDLFGPANNTTNEVGSCINFCFLTPLMERKKSADSSHAPVKKMSADFLKKMH